MTKFSARVHVLLARDAPTGLIIRRGPSKWACTIGWDRDTDTFAVGQWLHGRIYERRSDLSPDGRHFLYFAMNGRWETESHGSWTALSRTPYLKAIGMWPKGDCWHGGGLFDGNDRYWLDGSYDNPPLCVPSALKRIATWRKSWSYRAVTPTVYDLRLTRDGWTCKGSAGNESHSESAIFEKWIGGIWVLRKHTYAQGKGRIGTVGDFDSHELMNRKTGQRIDGSKWEWADFDRYRLVFVEAGKLFASRFEREGMGPTVELHDFNSMKFEAISSPY